MQSENQIFGEVNNSIGTLEQLKLAKETGCLELNETVDEGVMKKLIKLGNQKK